MCIAVVHVTLEIVWLFMGKSKCHEVYCLHPPVEAARLHTGDSSAEEVVQHSQPVSPVPGSRGNSVWTPADEDLLNVFLAGARLTGHCSGSLWNLFWTEQS